MNKLKAFKLLLVLNVLLSLNPVLASPVSAENESESRDYSNNIEYSLSYSDDYSFAYLKINLNTDDDVYLDFTNNVDISNNIEQGKYIYDVDGKSYIFTIVKNGSYNFDTIVLANDENKVLGNKTISVDIADVSGTGVVMNAYNSENSDYITYGIDYRYNLYHDDTVEWAFCYWDENNIPNSVDNVNIVEINDIDNLDDLSDIYTGTSGFFDERFNGKEYYVYKHNDKYLETDENLNMYEAIDDLKITIAFNDFQYSEYYDKNQTTNDVQRTKKYILFFAKPKNSWVITTGIDAVRVNPYGSGKGKNEYSTGSGETWIIGDDSNVYDINQHKFYNKYLTHFIGDIHTGGWHKIGDPESYYPGFETVLEAAKNKGYLVYFGRNNYYYSYVLCYDEDLHDKQNKHEIYNCDFDKSYGCEFDLDIAKENVNFSYSFNIIFPSDSGGGVFGNGSYTPDMTLSVSVNNSDNKAVVGNSVNLNFSIDGIPDSLPNTADLITNTLTSIKLTKINGASAGNLALSKNNDGTYSVNNIPYTITSDDVANMKVNINAEFEVTIASSIDSTLKPITSTYTVNQQLDTELDLLSVDTNNNNNTNIDDATDSKAVTCEEYMNSKDWTWSESKKACVYRVINTSAN